VSTWQAGNAHHRDKPWPVRALCHYGQALPRRRGHPADKPTANHAARESFQASAFDKADPSKQKHLANGICFSQ
jgi:hypothetical protein